MAIALDRADLEHFLHRRKFCWTLLASARCSPRESPEGMSKPQSENYRPEQAGNRKRSRLGRLKPARQPGRRGRADMQAPRAALVCAPLLALLHAAQGNDEEPEQSGDIPQENVRTNEETPASTFAAMTTETLPTDMNSTLIAEDTSQLEFILVVLVPVILLVLLLSSVVLIVINYKRKRTKQEPSSQGSQSALQTYELGSENLKVPIFEEDTPSVMEIEMEELDKWMNSMNRNADSECLPTLKEEKESNHNPSDNES
ncbi:transmembrane protein 154 [Cynocephalus volans]|uniref:transmembrane protein 154 n=1 Tax=Cynocephalus volans TaxID=110931 RepID=UPI002FC70076